MATSGLGDDYRADQPMRIQVRQGSEAEQQYYHNSSLPKGGWPKPKPEVIAPGISPKPLEDLLYHGGKIVPQMQFQNIYLGGEASWQASDIEAIDLAITLAMQDSKLNNVIKQYFVDLPNLSCDPRHSTLLEGARPEALDEPDVQETVVQLYREKKLSTSDLDSVIFNLLLPAGSVLKLGSSTSLRGLGGYHGSVHFDDNGKRVTLYYSANVFSQQLTNGPENGIAVFDAPWKNVVATLYHELNEFRTDPDVRDAIETGENHFLGWTSAQGREIGDQPVFVARPLSLVFQEIAASSGNKRIPVQLMYSNAVHGAEGPISQPH